MFTNYSLEFSPCRSIRPTLVQFGPLQSNSIHFGLIWSILVQFGVLMLGIFGLMQIKSEVIV